MSWILEDLNYQVCAFRHDPEMIYYMRNIEALFLISFLLLLMLLILLSLTYGCRF